MQEHTLSTVFYKYKRFAAAKMILYVIAAIGFIIGGSGNIYMILVGVAILVGVPLWSAINQRSFFSLRAWDDRKLIVTPGYIQIGADKYEFENIQSIAIYLGGYYGFSFGRSSQSGSRGYGSVNGDDNVLAFRYQGKTQSYEFFLRDFDSYVAICHIIDAWKKSGKSFVLKEQFSRDYIRDQVRTHPINSQS
jgi:hypothetical protein